MTERLGTDATRSWPHWESPDGSVLLIHGDALEVAPTLSGIDALISDPPYGIGYQHSGHGGRPRLRNRPMTRFHEPITGDDVDFDPSPWLGFPIVALFGANHYAARLPASGSWLCWDKSMGRGPADDFSDGEFIWTNVPRIKRNVLRVLWKGCSNTKKIEDCKYKGGVVRQHPSKKPLDLMVQLMNLCKVPAGATVLDPYCGSGSTGVACFRTHRRFVGIEIEERYWKTAVRRCRAEFARTPLLAAAERKTQGSLI